MHDFINSPPPIVICSTKGTSLPVLLASIAAYVPEQVTIYLATTKPVDTSHMPQKCVVLPNTAGNFGDAYNAAIESAFHDGHSGAIMANDDTVLTPTTHSLLMHDLAFLYASGRKIGLVATRSDNAMTYQNIRLREEQDEWTGFGWRSEMHLIKHVPVIAPIYAWISAEAFSHCRFPPINSASDLILCEDLTELGYQHFVSRAYIHHVGGVTTGIDSTWAQDNAWLWAHRPQMAESLNGNDCHKKWQVKMVSAFTQVSAVITTP